MFKVFPSLLSLLGFHGTFWLYSSVGIMRLIDQNENDENDEIDYQNENYENVASPTTGIKGHNSNCMTPSISHKTH